MEQERDAPAIFWGPAQRSVTILAVISVILGFAAYIIYIADSYSGGYGPHAAFPPLRDHGSLRMTLTRTFCLGRCPDYSVEIRGDSTVIYEGNMCVAVHGHHDGRIALSRVDELFEEFKRAEFLSLRNSYFAWVTDQPTYVISLRYHGVSKAVTDYAGRRAGMPDAVTNLENAIDAIAGTDVWVRGEDRSC